MTIIYCFHPCCTCGSTYSQIEFACPLRSSLNVHQDDVVGECYECIVRRLDEAQIQEQEPERNYHYFMTWTKKPDSSFDAVRRNFVKFSERATTLGITDLWSVEEHLDTNPHIHAYVCSKKPLTRSRYRYYEREGHIDKQKAKGNKDEIRDYMSKENDLKIWNLTPNGENCYDKEEKVRAR